MCCPSLEGEFYAEATTRRVCVKKARGRQRRCLAFVVGITGIRAAPMAIFLSAGET